MSNSCLWILPSSNRGRFALLRPPEHEGGAATCRSDDLLDSIELPDVAGRQCDELSKGMRQKIQFAAAIVNEPDLLILDEPFSGLDPVSMRLLRERILSEHARGGRFCSRLT